MMDTETIILNVEDNLETAELSFILDRQKKQPLKVICKMIKVE